MPRPKVDGRRHPPSREAPFSAIAIEPVTLSRYWDESDQRWRGSETSGLFRLTCGWLGMIVGPCLYTNHRSRAPFTMDLSRSFCRTRSSFTCVPSGNSPTSSRKTVPSSASSSRPGFAWRRARGQRVRSPAGPPGWPQSYGDEGPPRAGAVAVQGVRDEFLARLGLARDEHRGVGWRHLPDELEDFAHRRVPPDEAARLLPRQRARFGPQTLQPHPRLDTSPPPRDATPPPGPA
jgi:hypothetical protein